jgi:exodeoxyribonuclease VII large subunit
LQLDRLLRQESQVVTWLRQRLTQSVQRRFENQTQRCQVLREKLESLDPQVVLQRGYAIARSVQGEIVRSAEEVQPGENLTIQLGQGQITVTVNAVANASSQAAELAL